MEVSPSMKGKKAIIYLFCVLYGVYAPKVTAAPHGEAISNPTLLPLTLPNPPLIPEIPGTPVPQGSLRHSLSHGKKKRTRIVITTIPRRVNVLLNGVLIGQTPLDTFVNSSSSVTMDLLKQGYARVRVPVRLRPGETFSLRLRLERQAVWRPYVP